MEKTSQCAGTERNKEIQQKSAMKQNQFKNKWVLREALKWLAESSRGVTSLTPNFSSPSPSKFLSFRRHCSKWHSWMAIQLPKLVSDSLGKNSNLAPHIKDFFVLFYKNLNKEVIFHFKSVDTELMYLKKLMYAGGSNDWYASFWNIWQLYRKYFYHLPTPQKNFPRLWQSSLWCDYYELLGHSFNFILTPNLVSRSQHCSILTSFFSKGTKPKVGVINQVDTTKLYVASITKEMGYFTYLQWIEPSFPQETILLS